MRTFLRERAEFTRIGKERGERLRQVPFVQLKEHPFEEVRVGSRRGKIAVLVLPLPGGGVQVVVQGFLEHHLFPGASVALDGFQKYPDETITPMPPGDFWRFD